MEPFVVASKTTTALRDACELLFIHGNDLTWGGPEFGIFLVDKELDDISDTLEVDRARGEMGLVELTRGFIPVIRSFAGDIAREAANAKDDAERQAMMGAFAAARFSKKKPEEFERALPDLMRLLPAFSGWLASGAGAAALELRERQESAAGLDEDGYDDMVQAVEQLGSITSAVYRVAVPASGASGELAIGGAYGFLATTVDEDAQYVEVLRVAPWLALLKLGEDISLALFIAHWINSHYPGRPCAFPCARMGSRDGPEIDVVIPLLSLGIEVKLYQSPKSVVPSKLDSYAGDLAKQLPDYYNLGCENVFVVTNLPPSGARGLTERLGRAPSLGGKKLHVTGGRLDGLLPLLNEIIGNLQPHIQRELGFP